MQLENVTAKIRSRGRWESIDLGCAMARRSYGALLGSWLLTVVPMWLMGILGFGIISSDGWHLFWSICWCWLTLGVGDRVLMLLLSRELFGEKVKVSTVVKLWWCGMMYRGFFRALLRRFSVSRALSLAVSELEEVKGYRYKARVRLLTRNGGDGAAQASMVSLLLVFLLICGFYMMIMLVSQLYGDSDVMSMFFEDVGRYGDEYAGLWLFFFFYLIAVSLIEPFFIGAGFAMYINSRTITEGWDIELSFKRMSERLKSRVNAAAGKTLLIALVSAVLAVSSGQALAVTKDPRVEKIMKNDDFDVHHKSWQEMEYSSSSSSSGSSSSSSRSSSYSSSSSSTSASGVGALFQGVSLLIFWSLVAIVVALIVWVIYMNRHAFKKTGNVIEEDDAPKIKSVMGMDVTPESLPLEVHEEARNAWNRGEHHFALSLLYRGAISWMVHQGRVPIVESDTEGDCVLRVHEKALATGGYFDSLTQIWVKQAYGDRLPSDEVVMTACDQWPFKQKGGRA